MEELPNYYITLLRATENAIHALDAQNYGQAKDLLIRGQLDAEEDYVAGVVESGAEVD